MEPVKDVDVLGLLKQIVETQENQNKTAQSLLRSGVLLEARIVRLEKLHEVALRAA